MEEISKFRNLPEAEAYNWLLENYPPINEANAANAIFFLSKRTWKKSRQPDVLRTYIPLINGTFFKYAIDNLSKTFGRETVEKCIIDCVPSNTKNRHFAEYYLYGESYLTRLSTNSEN